MRIERFEDIKAWQEARVLVKTIYDAINLVHTSLAITNSEGKFRVQQFQ